jgi:hypothetical protein
LFVAKGNDGNYLQHSVEVAAAVHLAARHPEGRLHVALAHGMEPFEPCGELPNGQARKLLHKALRAAQEVPKAGESSIVAAYRAANASLDHYPNTSELLRRVIGQDRLSGGITEVDATKYARLENAWAGSRVRPVRSSWRTQIGPGGVLTSPAALEAPWFFTMDPMTFRENGNVDDNNLYRADLPRVSSAMSSFVASGKSGVAALFVYAVKPEVQPQFWTFVDDLAGQTGTTVASCWLTHQGGNRNLAALVCSAFVLPPNWLPYGLNAGR